MSPYPLTNFDMQNYYQNEPRFTGVYFRDNLPKAEDLGQPLIVLYVTTASISITSFATVIGAPVGMASASVSPEFPIFTGIVKKPLKTIRHKKEKTQ